MAKRRGADPTGRPLDRLRRPLHRGQHPSDRVAIGGKRSWHQHGHRVPVRDLTASKQNSTPLHLHAVTMGQGPDVLLLHGFVQASWAWRHNIEALSAHFTVHALCLPGFGWSDKPKAASFRLAEQARRVLLWMTHMNISRADLVGNSLGGALALQLAALEPDRVRRMVLVNPAGAGSYPMAWLARMQLPAWAPALALPGIPFGLKLGLRYGAYRKLPVDDDYMSHFLAPLGTHGAAHAALSVAQSYNADLSALERRIGGILQPTLIVRGGADRVMPDRIVTRIAEQLPHSRLVRFSESGHCPMEEEPGRFNRVCAGFLRDEAPGDDA